jgi:hypothetical protein
MMVASDRSSPVLGRRKSIIYEDEVDRYLAAGRRILALEDDRVRRWRAFCDEGHTSAVAETTIMQLISESQCPAEGCIATPRSFEHTPVLHLYFPENVQDGRQYKLDKPLAKNMTLNLSSDQGLRCPASTESSSGDPHPLRFRVKKKFGKMPNVVSIAIVRGSGIQGAPIHLNPVNAPEILDLSDFIDKGKWLYSERSPGERVATGEPHQYRLAALIVYSHTIRHYKSYVKVGSRNDGPWWVFDDMMERPSQETPKSGKIQISKGKISNLSSNRILNPTQGFIPTLLVYVKDGQEQEQQDITISEPLNNDPSNSGIQGTASDELLPDAPSNNYPSKGSVQLNAPEEQTLDAPSSVTLQMTALMPYINAPPKAINDVAEPPPKDDQIAASQQVGHAAAGVDVNDELSKIQSSLSIIIEDIKNGKVDDVDRIQELFKQQERFLKQKFKKEVHAFIGSY